MNLIDNDLLFVLVRRTHPYWVDKSDSILRRRQYSTCKGDRLCHYLEFVCAGFDVEHLDSSNAKRARWLHLTELRSPCLFINHRRQNSRAGRVNAEFYLMEGMSCDYYVGLRAIAFIGPLDEITCGYLC